jgi:hypothetical protein
MHAMAEQDWSRLDKHALGEELKRQLAEARTLRLARLADPRPADHLSLKQWQSERLAATYADLAEDPRYRPAVQFFLDELYGTKDFTARDAEIERIVPTLVAMLPARALHTLCEAMRMDALSESLDADMVAALRQAGCLQKIDRDAYAKAYRACGRPDDREAQITLVGDIGRTLDHLTRMPLLGGILRMMKKPAELAGLGHLHKFLQTGFVAFAHMKGADHFLETILGRETELMNRLRSGG